MRVKNYDRRAALAYASRWALSRNPDYYDYNEIGGDCTNFVSQCVYAGSGVMNYTDTYGWYYINSNDKSPSWTGVEYFYNFMTSNEGIGPFGEERAPEYLLPGDVIQLGDSSGRFYHTLFLNGFVGSGRRKQYFVSSHSSDAYMRNLNTYDFAQIRGIHIIGVRTGDDL